MYRALSLAKRWNFFPSQTQSECGMWMGLYLRSFVPLNMLAISFVCTMMVYPPLEILTNCLRLGGTTSSGFPKSLLASLIFGFVVCMGKTSCFQNNRRTAEERSPPFGVAFSLSRA